MSKIILQMDRDAFSQRQAIEEIIEEKVSKVIAGSSVELNMAVHEVKKEGDRMSKIALRTPPREKTPPRGRSPVPLASKRRRSFASPGLCLLPLPINGSNEKSNTSDNPCIHGRGSVGSVAAKNAGKETEEKSLEESFAETMRVIDEFVYDCDGIVDDFDNIALRMQDAEVPYDLEDCDSDDFEYLGFAG